MVLIGCWVICFLRVCVLVLILVRRWCRRKILLMFVVFCIVFGLWCSSIFFELMFWMRIDYIVLFLLGSFMLIVFMYFFCFVCVW